MLDNLPAVSLDRGRCKFVHVKVTQAGGTLHEFVRSRKNASLHHMVADELLEHLRTAGVKDEEVEVPGGGRCEMDDSHIKIYGYSNQYGEADLPHVAELIRTAYPKHEVTFSRGGY